MATYTDADQRLLRIAAFRVAFETAYFGDPAATRPDQEVENENPAGTNRAYGAPVCLTIDDIWADIIPTPAPGVSTTVVEFFDCVEMYERTDRPGSYIAIRPTTATPPGISDDEFGTRLTKWITARHHSSYDIQIKRAGAGGALLLPDHASGPLFDPATGVLDLLDPSQLPPGDLPLQVEGYVYIGQSARDLISSIGGGGGGPAYTRYDKIDVSGDGSAGSPRNFTLSGGTDLDPSFIDRSIVIVNGNVGVFGLDYTLIAPLTLRMLETAGRSITQDCDEIQVLAIAQ